jgi:hypothetical protein
MFEQDISARSILTRSWCRVQHQLKTTYDVCQRAAAPAFAIVAEHCGVPAAHLRGFSAGQSMRHHIEITSTYPSPVSPFFTSLSRTEVEHG